MKKKKTRLKLIYPVFIVMLLIWFFEIGKEAAQISFSFLPEALTKRMVNAEFLKITGLVVITLSLILLHFALYHFKKSFRFGLDENNLGKLITSGIFSKSRNPFFLSIDLYILGITAILPTFFFTGFTVLTLAGIHLFILKEERFLQKNYGEEYQRYAKRTPRYFSLSGIFCRPGPSRVSE